MRVEYEYKSIKDKYKGVNGSLFTREEYTTKNYICIIDTCFPSEKWDG